MSTLILCFHRVADPAHGGRSLLSIAPEDFRKTLETVGSRFTFVELAEGAEPSRTRKAVVTFDDGYADNLHTAMPILQDMGIPATFFISTGFIGTDYLYPPDALDAYFSSTDHNDVSPQLGALLEDGYWTALDHVASMDEEHYWQVLREVGQRVRGDVLAADPLRRPMSLGELRDLAALPGVTLGPHTVTHRRLSSLSPAEAIGEFVMSLEWLESQGFGVEDFFAYPFGQRPDMVKALSAGIRKHGVEPLTTLPALVSDASRFHLDGWGTPRLSVGPAEVPLIPLLLQVLPLASAFAPLWLGALALRRKFIAG